LHAADALRARTNNGRASALPLFFFVIPEGNLRVPSSSGRRLFAFKPANLSGMTDPDTSDYQEPLIVRQNRLRDAFAHAADHAANMNKQAVQSSIEVGKERTQYFEKVSLGCGATVALIVSFVGAHAGRLQPRWLLRSALVSLVSAMIFGLLRNWIFPWYTYAAMGHQDFDAKLAREYAKKKLISIGFAVSIEDGQQIDPDAWLRNFEKDESFSKERIAYLIALRDRSFNWTARIEYLTLILACVGMGLLVALAWLNF